MGEQRAIYQTNEGLLRRTLMANAIFSAIFGLVFITANATVTDLIFAKQFSLWGFGAADIV